MKTDFRFWHLPPVSRVTATGRAEECWRSLVLLWQHLTFPEACLLLEPVYLQQTNKQVQCLILDQLQPVKNALQLEGEREKNSKSNHLTLKDPFKLIFNTFIFAPAQTWNIQIDFLALSRWWEKTRIQAAVWLLDILHQDGQISSLVGLRETDKPGVLVLICCAPGELQ